MKINHILLVVSGVAVIQVNCMNDLSVDIQKAKAFGGLLAAGIVIGGAQKIANSDKLKKISDNLSVNSTDVANVIGISAGCYALSNLMTDNKSQLQHFAIRAPIAAAVSGIVLTNRVQSLLRSIPFLGQYITCSKCACKSAASEQIEKSVVTDPQTACPGICNDCRLTKGVVVIGSYVFANSLLALTNNKLGTDI
jgi:hypothetical protein